MSKLRYILLILSLSICISAFDINGNIKSKSTGLPTEGVKIEIIKVECGKDLYIMTATTGTDGNYLVGGLVEGKYMVKPIVGWYTFEPVQTVIEIKE